MAVNVDISPGDSSDTSTPLLQHAAADVVVDSADDCKRSGERSNLGGWRSASFIIGVEVAERFAYYGIASNLISYLTGPLGQSTATAAVNVNTWSGVATLLPLVGAFVADSFLGRYRTIIVASIIYILGLGLLTLSAAIPTNCQDAEKLDSCSPQLQVILFFFSLYLVAAGQGGHKPCVQAFGADQFDGDDPKECKDKNSFFNWWYFSMCCGTLVTLPIINYIQDNLNWSLGFGIPCVSMVLALVVFIGGTKTYRFSIKENEKDPFTRIGRVFVKAAKNWKISPARTNDEESREVLTHQCSQKFRLLNRALIVPDGVKEDSNICSISDVEEAKSVLSLIPIWTTCLPYAVVFAQYQTFFTKQGATMDRTIWPGFNIPAASLQSCISLTIVIFIPIYDRILVPIARSITHKPSGFTMLQRIGTGIFLSIISMILSALVEKNRLETALKNGLIDLPNVTVPMSIWWLVPQYIVFGAADVFTMVGLQEFFYDQMPSELRSMGLAFYLSIFGVGSFLSSFLVSTINKVTSMDGNDSWFSNNLNRAHLDYFYWMLAGLSAVGLAGYLCFSKRYLYNNKGRST